MQSMSERVLVVRKGKEPNECDIMSFEMLNLRGKLAEIEGNSFGLVRE